jgi:hypothetical protein
MTHIEMTQIGSHGMPMLWGFKEDWMRRALPVRMRSPVATPI